MAIPTDDRALLRFTLSGDRTASLIFSGPPPTQAEIEELIDYLTVARRTFPPAAQVTWHQAPPDRSE